MGTHYVREDLFDTTVHGSEPEVLVFGPDGTLWSLEYESAAATENPRVLGQDMPFLVGGHPGMEFDHYVMHAWMIENPAGRYVDFNPNVTCEAPAAPIAPPSTGSGGLLAEGGTSDSQLVSLAVLVSVFGGLGAFGLRRRLS